jgi:hypothetical protein
MSPPRQSPKYVRGSAKIYVAKLWATGALKERVITGAFA